jgi:hypothetical protein
MYKNMYQFNNTRPSQNCRPGALNLLQTEGQINTRLSSRGPQVYKWGQFIKTSWYFINDVTNLLVQPNLVSFQYPLNFYRCYSHASLQMFVSKPPSNSWFEVLHWVEQFLTETETIKYWLH